MIRDTLKIGRVITPRNTYTHACLGTQKKGPTCAESAAAFQMHVKLVLPKRGLHFGLCRAVLLSVCDAANVTQIVPCDTDLAM
jgi:hypothetical protein